ncbi:hypothetical protein QQA05_09640 [Corynebacterium macclintockiae]|uniref:hypothetical protein n=1 Tax=Corynebacterium macclintockiae TaxID=2913501 RepID=UPI00254C9D62|nr:hypothetical protein [Corynebacterium macclintockiae]MDK8891653.1 hypothetical protein [Corynebacterium macclintockiae]
MNIRKAALALATASSVALTGTAVAGAETANANCTQPAPANPVGSAAAGKALGANKCNTGAEIFGSSKGEDIKGWGVALWAGLAAGFAGTIASIIIGVGNYLKHQGIIK